MLHLPECPPQVLCLTEHHLKDFEIYNLCIKNYKLVAYYCRKTHKLGGVRIYVQDYLSCTPIGLTKCCNELDLEVCALKINDSKNVFCITCIYRPPTGNFGTFIYLLQSALDKLHSNSINFINCGDVNINYLKDSNYKTKLNSLLATYNLHSAVDFPTRVTESPPQQLIIFF